ncbi:MAG TPA: acetylglutamate kinase [Gemmataceae bacterium]|jgi:acetylglutamate kinase|nr:acetylglutamate kinase [Gemmataceae bacterium]
MDDAIRKADALIEALPYIRNFRACRSVIKLGGSAMEDPAALTATLQDVVFMETVGLRPVLVHGGGKPIDRAMAEAGLTPVKRQGRRVTDDATLGLVVRVLRETVNADIVRQIRQLGGRAVGLHTDTLQALSGEKLLLSDKHGEPLDLGRVGQVTRVDAALIQSFADAGVVPVIPSLAYDEAGRWLNVNADTAAAAVAGALKAAKLVFLTDTPGILADRNDARSTLPSLNMAAVEQLITDGVIDAGMLPKVEACRDGLRAGVGKVHVIDGRLRHSLLLEIYTDRGVGTEIVL